MKLATLIVIAALALSSCGRKGDPIDPKPEEPKQEQPSS